MAIKRIGNRAPTVLSIEQKIAAALLLFLFTGGIFFGFRSFGANLYRPIQQQFANNVTGKDVVHENAQEQKDMEALKTKDTDGDLLSDYDELYVYKTSPYLKDSDSDLIDDKTEVFGGTDPNCPEGKECGTGLAIPEQAAPTQNATTGLLGSVAENPGFADSANVQFNSKADVEAFFKKATMAEVRSALVKSGQISEAELSKMTDAELKVFFDSAIGQAASSGKLDSMVTGTSTTQPVTQTTPAKTPVVQPVPKTNP